MLKNKMEKHYLIMSFTSVPLDNEVAKSFFEKLSLSFRNKKANALLFMLKKSFPPNEIKKIDYGFRVDFHGSLEKCQKAIKTYEKKITPKLNKESVYVSYELLTESQYLLDSL